MGCLQSHPIKQNQHIQGHSVWTVYSTPVCPNAQVLKLMLHEKRQKFHVEEISQATDTEWLKSVNKDSQMPMLKHENSYYCGLYACINQVEVAVPSPTLLLQNDDKNLAAAESLARLVRSYLMVADDDDNDAVKTALLAALEDLDARIDLPFLNGTELCAPDLIFFTWTERLKVAEHFKGWQTSSRLSRLHKWLDNMRTRYQSYTQLFYEPEYILNWYRPIMQPGALYCIPLADKALRCGITELLLALNAIDFADAVAVGTVLENFQLFSMIYLEHVRHEEEFLWPYLMEKRPSMCQSVFMDMDAVNQALRAVQVKAAEIHMADDDEKETMMTSFHTRVCK